MRSLILTTAAMLLSSAAPLLAQNSNAPDLGEVVVTANRMSARYYQQERPVVGLRREADSAVQRVMISSDSRDEATRKREIHAMLLAALDRASAAGIELVTGNFELTVVTRANYQDLVFSGAGRVDTSKIDLMAKAKLAGSAGTAQQRLDTFVKGVPPSGRALMEKLGGLTLTIVNPDQYRDTIVKLVADHARRNAAMFGPEYKVSVSGIDGQVAWSQVSNTEVFLYIPYNYTIEAD
jgi:hypothetical protein